MELYDHPVPGHKNKFVVTEETAYFVPCASGEDDLRSMVLTGAFDLRDLEVVKVLNENFESAPLILGYWEQDGGLNVYVSLERNEYVGKRLSEVLGG